MAVDATKVTEILNTSGIIENIAANTPWWSKVFNVDGFFSGIISMLLGRTTTSAASAAGQFIVEYNLNASGDAGWREFAKYDTQFAACESEAVTGAPSSGASTLSMSSTTNLTVGELVYIKDGSVLADSEWRKIASVSANTNIGLDAPTTNAHTTATVYDLADEFSCKMDLVDIKRIRVRLQNFSQSADVFVQGIFWSAFE